MVGSALVIVLVGCTSAPASIGPSVGPSVAASPPASPSVEPTSVPTLAPTPGPSYYAGLPTAVGWRQVPDQPSVTDGQPLAVVWTGRRFVATSIGADNGGDVLDSVDGITWHRGARPVGTSTIGLLAVGPRGIVALGTSETASDAGTAALASPDGLTWTSRDNAFPVFGLGTDTVQVTDVVATGTGWLAVGREDPECQFDCNLAPVRALVWTSGDGLHWTRVANQTSFGHAAMTSVTLGGPGFVAVGQAGNHAAVWTSTDGKAWSRVPDATLFHAPSGTDQTFGAWMTDVAAADGTIVAVGMVGTQGDVGSALAWWSTDGRHWSRATGKRFLYGQLFSVGVVPGGFLAVGPSGSDSCLGGMWASADGRAWACIASKPAFTNFGPYTVAASPDLVVVVGLGAEGSNGAIGVIWIR